MRSAFGKDVARSIVGSLGRFLAIMGIVALGCGFYAGLQMCGPNMRADADALYDGTALWDLRLISTLGFGDDDVARVSGVEGAEQVMPSLTCDAMARLGTEQVAVRISSLDVGAAQASEPDGLYAVTSDDAGYLNRPRLVDGRWPTAPGECVISADVPRADYGIGDTVELLYGSMELSELLSCDRLAIVGTVSSSNYPYTGNFGSTSLGAGMIDQYLYVAPASLAQDAPYTELYLTVAGAAGELSESAAYEQVVGATKGRLEDLAGELSRARQDDLKAEAQEKLDEKWDEYDEEKAKAEAELADAKAELEDAAAQIADGEAELADGEARYQEGLAQYRSERDAAYQRLADGEAQYQDGLAQYHTERKKALRTLDDAAAEIADNQATLDAGRSELEDGRDELEAGEAAYEQGLAELLQQTGAQDLDGAEQVLKDGLAALEDGVAQVEAGIAQIEALPSEGELRTAAAAAQTGIEQAQAGIERAQAGIGEADDAIALAQTGVDEADATIASLSGQREALAQQLADLQAQKAQLEQALEAAPEEERAGLVAQLSAVDDGIAQTQAGMAQLDEGIAQAQAGKAAAEAGLAQAQAGRRAAEQAKAQAQAGLAQAQAGLSQAQEGLAQVQAAAKTLPGLRAQLAELESQRTQAQEALSGVATLRQSCTQLDAARTKLDEGMAQLDEGQAQLDKARGELARGRKTTERELASAWRELESARLELSSGRAAAERELRKAWSTLQEAADELASGRAELEDARSQYDEGLASYEDGRAEADEKFGDALAQLKDAQREIDDIELPDVYVLDRTQSEGAATYHADAGRIDAIADVFPLIFFLVAALVALTTMTRMVEDDRVLIGTYKALGYGTAAIAAKYLAYAGIAGTVGAAVGIALLSQVLPYIVMSAYSIIYTVPIHPFPLPVDAPIALAAGGLGVGVTLLATWGAVVSSLREVPATLMLPRAPKAGKRILLERVRPVWQRLSFTWKVTCRNLFRYKRRFLMTVIGISGCTALLLVGFGLHDAIWDIIDRQYGPIVHFDTTVGLDDKAIELDVRRAASYLEGTGEVTGIVRVQNENMQAGAPGTSETIRVNVVVPRDAREMAGALTFRNRLSGEPLMLSDDAVLVTEKLSLKYGLSPGSTILLFDQDDVGNAVGQGHALTVTGVAENYVGNLVYVGREAWRSVDASTPVFSTIYASTTADETVRKGITDELHAMEGVSTVIFSDETINMYRKMLSVVDMIVVVLIVSAAALAYIVLYNLTNINIGERIREIASLKVLGFTRGEVQSYIFREIALLAVMGDALGLLLGIFLERFVVVTAEVDYVMFGRTIHGPSFVYAFVLTLAFAGLVILSMRRKLDRVDMVESLKSVD